MRIKKLIAALKGEADQNQDGYLTGTELGMFLQDKVVNYRHSSFGFRCVMDQ